MSEWISVKVQMPPHNTVVQARAKKGDPFGARYVYGEGWKDMHGDRRFVTHWRSMPRH